MFQTRLTLAEVPLESDGSEVAISYPPLMRSGYKEGVEERRHSRIDEDYLFLYGYRFKHVHLHAIEWVSNLSPLYFLVSHLYLSCIFDYLLLLLPHSS